MTAYKLNALAMMTDKQLTKAGFDPKEITLEVICREGELSQLRAEMREVAALKEGLS